MLETYLDSVRHYVANDTRKYYTSFSFILFFVALVLPHGVLKTVLLLNSIMVGLVGNVIVMYSFDKFRRQVREEAPAITDAVCHRSILESNFLKHTLPMILSSILLFGCPTITYASIPTYYVMLLSLILVWTCVPHNGLTMKEKIEDSYPGFKARELMAMTLSLIALTFWIAYLQSKSNLNK